MSRIQITAKATTQGRKKQKQTLTTGDLLIENGLGGDPWRSPRSRLLARGIISGLPSDMVLLIAADFPPIQLFELGHLFGPVLRIPVLPSRCIGRHSCVRYLMQREERPVAHLRGNLGICR